MNNLPGKNTSKNNFEEDDSVDLKKILNNFFEKWYWFLTSIIICFCIAFLYAKYSTPIYQINARLLVNDDEKGGGLSKQAGALMDLGGLMGSKNSVDNEAEILKTRFLMEQVVRKMQLNIVYSIKKNLVSKELYDSPIKVEIVSGVDTIKKTVLNIKQLPKNKLLVTAKDFKTEVAWGMKFRVSGVGIIRISKATKTPIEYEDIYTTISSIDERVIELMKQLSVGVTNKQVSIVDLGFRYGLTKKGEDILTVLISQYVEANLGDKNAIADSTSKFIKQRLVLIASELGDFENKVEKFKQNNRLSDMSEQGKILVQNTGELTTELAKAETQVAVLNDLENYMKDESKNKRVFPSSLVPQDVVFSNLMGQYNALLIERDKQLLSVTEESPFIKNIDDQIIGLRKGILSNIQSTKNTFTLNRDKLRNQLSSAQSQISGVPEIEKNYLKLARNRDIKQELYIFLMQKAEETAISKTSNISVAKVIDPPKAEINPISPRKSLISLIGIFIGLVIPVVVIYINDLLKTSIITKEDITNLTNVPIVGEISHNLSDDNMIVANQSRSAISEQFRALRTNLSFYLKSKNENVILLTSSMSGEGKSFTAINLANILALSDKKVLLMELDLRKPGLSSKLGVDNSIGFSNYTITPDLKISDIVKPLSINKNMFIISSGPLPPNPAETLMSEHMAELVNELKKEFDYIIMDAPPIGIITDAQLLAQYADVTLYLVRQKVTQRAQLSIVNDIYKNSKMKNVSIVVNDIVNKFYGYGYGYGNYGQEQPQSIFQKIGKYIKSIR